MPLVRPQKPQFNFLRRDLDVIGYFRNSFSYPYISNAATSGAFVSMPRYQIFIVPFYMPIRNSVLGYSIRTSSQTSVWSQNSVSAYYPFQVNMMASDSDGMPDGPFLLSPNSSFIIPNNTAVNTPVPTSLSSQSVTLPMGLVWFFIMNTIASSTVTTPSLAGIAASSGERTSLDTILFNRLVNGNATSSILPACMVQDSGTGNLTAYFNNTLPKIQYNTSTASPSALRLRTNAPFIQLQLGR